MKKKIYLHIGFGKTGSTSLQFFLFSNPELQTSDHQEKILYCAFNLDGSISTFKKITCMKKRPAGHYLSHPGIANIADLSKTKNDLDKILSAGYTPIFSQEAWGDLFSEFKDSNFLSQLGCSAHVIVYVRPQVEWLNSSWWQWHAWSGKFSTPSDLVDSWGYYYMLWADKITNWRNLPGVESVRVRLQPEDIIADFISLLEIQESPEMNYQVRMNVTLSPTLIKLLLRYPELRGPHNIEIDDILRRNFKFQGKTPWFIEKELIGKIISATHADNLQLLSMLDEKSKNVMLRDLRWWSPESYASRPLFSTVDWELEKQELLAIVDQAIPALIKLELDRDKMRDQFLNSMSWKITKPLRYIRRLLVNKP
jgi:hypothetical protein